MSIPNWVCLDCKEEFKPIINEDDFSFNCPVCGSPRALVVRSKGLNLNQK